MSISFNCETTDLLNGNSKTNIQDKILNWSPQTKFSNKVTSCQYGNSQYKDKTGLIFIIRIPILARQGLSTESTHRTFQTKYYYCQCLQYFHPTLCYLCSASNLHWDARGRFKNAYKLLNLRACRFLPANKLHIFQCMGKIFCVEFQRVPLKFHTKCLTHTLKDAIFIQRWDFQST